jgi:hypothetical protein
MTALTEHTPMPAHLVALRLADTLEQLVALVDRELNAEATEGAPLEDPRWASAIASVVECASRSVAVLDEPDVMGMLIAAARSEQL